MDDLETLLEGEDVQPEKEAKPDTADAETKEAQAATEETKGDAPETEEADTATGDKDDTPPVSQDKETEKSKEADGRLVALLDEREKRQAAERRATELEARIQTQQAPDRPDPITDPEGARNYDASELEQRLFVERLNVSEAMHRNSKGDDLVNEAQAEFKKACDANPSLMQELQRQADPYGYAIKYVQDRKALSEIGDPAEYRKKIEAEVTAKFKADTEAKAKADADEKTRSELPESLAGEPTVAGRSSSANDGDQSMEELLE